MSRTVIRSIHRDDVPAVLRLFGQADMDDGRVLSEPQALELLDRIHETPGQQVYVAEEDGEIVGTFMLLIVQHLSHSGARSAVVEDVVVRSDQQGRGIGRQMMEYAADVARQAGCYKVMLSSGTARSEAHAFYERLGYERHGISFLLGKSEPPTG